MMEVAPRSLNLPEVKSTYEVSESEARERSKEYWAYLEQYESVWGRYPWEPVKQQPKSEYVYKPDPKQQARDRLEFLKAKRQLELEGEIWQLAERYGLAEFRSVIEKLPNRKQEAINIFGSCLMLYHNAQKLKGLLDELSLERRIEIFPSFVEALARGINGIQIVHPAEYEAMCKDTGKFFERLRAGLEAILDLIKEGADPSIIVSEMLAHDKSYLRSLNYKMDVMKVVWARQSPDIRAALRRHKETIRHKLRDLENLSLVDDLIPLELFEQGYLTGYADLRRFRAQITEVYSEIPREVMDKLWKDIGL